MTIGHELPDIAPALTPAQQALFASVPDAPRRAVDAVVAALGVIAPDRALLAVAGRGVAEAAVSNDLRRGVPFPQWALFHAIYRVYEHLRRAHGDDKPSLARIRGAMLGFLAHERQLFQPFEDTRERCGEMLRGFSDGLMLSGALGFAQPLAIVHDEDDIVVAEAARRTGEVLREVFAQLSPDELGLLQRCFGYGESVKDAAASADRSYRPALHEYHDLLARPGAQLRWKLRDIAAIAWRSGISAEVLEAVPPSAPALVPDGGVGAEPP